MTYIMRDGDGCVLSDGLQEHVARGVAQEWADHLDAPVWLRENGAVDDAGERINPGDGAR